LTPVSAALTGVTAALTRVRVTVTGVTAALTRVNVTLTEVTAALPPGNSSLTPGLKRHLSGREVREIEKGAWPVATP
jgi:hypothetical protein